MLEWWKLNKTYISNGQESFVEKKQHAEKHKCHAKSGQSNSNFCNWTPITVVTFKKIVHEYLLYALGITHSVYHLSRTCWHLFLQTIRDERDVCSEIFYPIFAMFIKTNANLMTFVSKKGNFTIVTDDDISTSKKKCQATKRWIFRFSFQGKCQT